jgi:hypothetical protein
MVYDFANAVSRTFATLHTLQYGEDQPILLFTQDPRGLGAQISRRLVGLRLALLFKRKVLFPHISEPPYGQVFQPIHSLVDYKSCLNDAVEFFSDNAFSARMVRLEFRDLWNNLGLREKVYSFVPEDFVSISAPKLFFDGLLLSFCNLIEGHQNIIKEAALRLRIDQAVLGVHIRRGDKSVETPYVPIDVYNRHIEQMCTTGRFRSVFVCSDDPGIFKSVRVPPNIDLVFDETERRYNNANHKLLIKNPRLSMQETQTAVKNIYLLGMCGAIIGQSNAHFAALAASHISFRSGGQPYGMLIDGYHVLRQSRLMRMLYTAKLTLRAVARRLLPWATMQHAKKKMFS